MEIAGLFFVLQFLVALITLFIMVASLHTAGSRVGLHRFYVGTTIGLASIALLCLISTSSLGGLAGLPDYLIEFGPPAFTAVLSAIIVARFWRRHARSR
jgi:hypothetical protein